MDGFSSTVITLDQDGPNAPLSISGNVDGHIDFYGYHAGSGHWIFCGWCSPIWSTDAFLSLSADFEHAHLSGACDYVFFTRDDVPEGGRGIVLMVAGSHHAVGILKQATLLTGPTILRLTPSDGATQHPSAPLELKAQQLTERALPSPNQIAIFRHLRRQPFDGANTLASLRAYVRMELDFYIPIAPSGFLLTGWIIQSPNTVTRATIRSGSLSTPLPLQNALRVSRPDVADQLKDRPICTKDCGFVIHAPGTMLQNAPTYLEVETRDGEIGYVPLPAPSDRGLDAAKYLLSIPTDEQASCTATFQTILGPALQSITHHHCSSRPAIECLSFGTPNPAPHASIVIPLHGRIDFLEYQLALFSQQDLDISDIIFILDDPSQTAALRALALSAYNRFKNPFRVLLSDRNSGYAIANNEALPYANAPFVCFMNSDICPDQPGFIARLTTHLADNPSLGAVGPLLLFEDGSVQHEGIEFRRQPQFAAMAFPHHTRKGRKPTGAGLTYPSAITGACLMMRTKDARMLGGFDEQFLIGDFEDTDLCLRLSAKGLGCAIDHDTRMFHLERHSQTASSEKWRMNLTLYNGWLHNTRWPSPPGCP